MVSTTEKIWSNKTITSENIMNFPLMKTKNASYFQDRWIRYKTWANIAYAKGLISGDVLGIIHNNTMRVSVYTNLLLFEKIKDKNLIDRIWDKLHICAAECVQVFIRLTPPSARKSPLLQFIADYVVEDDVMGSIVVEETKEGDAPSFATGESLYQHVHAVIVDHAGKKLQGTSA